MKPKAASRAFQALSNETRLNIFTFILNHESGEVGSSAIQNDLRLSAATVSRQLDKLETTELIVKERHGREVFVSANLPMVHSLGSLLTPPSDHPPRAVRSVS